MQKDIKFRAFDNKNKKWLLGYEYPNLGGFSMFGECVLMGEWENVATSFMFGKDGKTMEDLKLMQFTSIKDTNGKEIYEGDILEIELYDDLKWVTKVRKDNGTFVIDVEGSDYNVTALSFLDDEAIVNIIGNIYETKSE